MAARSGLAALLRASRLPLRSRGFASAKQRFEAAAAAKHSRSRAALAAVRTRIDRLDEQLLRALNQRARLALQIGRIKKRRKWPVYDVTREASVLRHVTRANGGPLSARAVEHIFQAILCECRRRERSRQRKSSIVHGR